MPVFIKAGYWERAIKGFRGWFNLDDWMSSFIPSWFSGITGIVKSDGEGNFLEAEPGVDYEPPIEPSSITPIKVYYNGNKEFTLIDHGNTEGLSDDDHPQYLLANGSREGATSQRQIFDSIGVKAGTASQAPLLLTPGTNLAITKEGALEFDGIHLYFTTVNGGSRYQLDQQSGIVSRAYVEKTADYTVTSSDYTINCTANSFTITMLTAVGNIGRIFNIKNTGAGIITVDGDGSELIDAELTQTLEQWDNIMLQSTGTSWIIL